MLRPKKKILIPSVSSRFKLKGGFWTVFLFKVHPCQEHKGEVSKGGRKESPLESQAVN